MVVVELFFTESHQIGIDVFPGPLAPGILRALGQIQEIELPLEVGIPQGAVLLVAPKKASKLSDAGRWLACLGQGGVYQEHLATAIGDN